MTDEAARIATAFPETVAAIKRLRIAWHSYRMAVHDDLWLHHAMRIDEIRGTHLTKDNKDG